MDGVVVDALTDVAGAPPMSSSTVAVVCPPNAARVWMPAVVPAGIVTDIENPPSRPDSLPPSGTGSLYKTTAISVPAGNPRPVTVIESPALGERSDTDNLAPMLVAGGAAGGVKPLGAPGPAGDESSGGAVSDCSPASEVVVAQRSGEAATGSTTRRRLPNAINATNSTERARRVIASSTAPSATSTKPASIAHMPEPVAGNTHSFTTAPR